MATFSPNASLVVVQEFAEPPTVKQTVKLYRYDGNTAEGTPTIFDIAHTAGQTQFSYTDSNISSGTTYTYQYVLINSAGIPQVWAQPDTYSVAPPTTTILADGNNDGNITRAELESSANTTNVGVVRYLGSADVNTPATIAIKVDVPSYAQAGSTITITNGNDTVAVKLTAADVTNKAFTVRMATPPADGTKVEITTKWSDDNGNSSLNGSDVATVQVHFGQDMAISVDNITTDNVINAAEAAKSVTITGKVSGTDVAVGDTVTITVDTPEGSKTYTGKVLSDKTFAIAVPGADLAANLRDADNNGKPEIVAKVESKDTLGNTASTQTSKEYGVDTQVPQNGKEPLVEITTDANNDGFINRVEHTDPINVKVSFDKATVAVGDTMVVSSDGAKKTFVLTTTQVSQGFITTSFASPASGASMTVTAQITDPAGNASGIGQDTAKLDLSNLTKDGVKVVITEDANNDGYINATELKGDVDVQVTLPKDTQAGDKLLVEATGTGKQEITITQTMIDSGKVNLAFSPPGNGVKFVVTAQVKDPAGNQSNIAKDSALMVLGKPGAPSVVITEDTNNDGYINAKELQGDVDAQIGLPSTAVIGDKLTITDNAGTKKDIILTEAHISAKAVDVAFPAPGDGRTITIKAVLTDKAGNISEPGIKSAIVDTTVFKGLSIEIITDANNDGLINAAELKDGKVDVSVSVPQGAAVGDTLTITASGNTPQVVSLTAEAIKAGSVVVRFNPTANNTDFVASASIKDKAGNAAGPVEDSAKIQTSAPGEPIVSITEDVNNDGYINARELQGDIDVSIALPGTAVAGDKLVVTDQSGAKQTITLSASDIQKSSVAVIVTNPGHGATVKVDAQLFDVAGNPSKVGSDSAILDLKVPGDGTQAPTVILVDDVDNNGYINAQEFKDGGEKIDVKVALVDAQGKPLANVEVGDSVIITDQVDKQQTITLTKEDIDKGYVTAIISTPANNSEAKATAVVVDPAGNQSQSGSDSAILSTTTLGAPSVRIIEDANNDGYINATELKGDVDVRITLPAGVKEGDTLTVTDNYGYSKDIVLSADQAQAGSIATTVPAPQDGLLQVSAVVTDKAGNISKPDTAAVTVDTTAFKGLGIEIVTDANNDGYINAAELKDGKVDVSVSVPQGAAVGDTLTITASGNTPQVVSLTAEAIKAGSVVVRFNPTANNTDFVASASIKDKAGNAAGPVEDSAKIQTSAPGEPIVTITEDGNNDGYINAKELQGDIDVSIALPGTAVAGDKLVVTDQSGAKQTITLSASDIQKSSVAVIVTNPGHGATVKVDAQLFDVAGNPSKVGSDSAILDLKVPGDSDGDGVADQAPTVILVDDVDNNGYINAQEFKNGGEKIDVKVALVDAQGKPLANVEVGDSVIITDQAGKQQTITLTQADIDKGYVTAVVTTPKDGDKAIATALVADPAGNQSKEGSDSAILDLKVPGDSDGDGVADQAPTVILVDDVDNNGYINAQEFKDGGEKIDVKVALVDAQGKPLANVEVGDSVIITDQAGKQQTMTLTQADIDKGYVTAVVTTPKDGDKAIATALVADPAGNQSKEGSDSAILDLKVPGDSDGDGVADQAPTVILVDDVDNNGYINAQEFKDGGEKIDVKVALVDAQGKPLANVEVGDSVIITDQAGKQQTITLTQADIDKGYVTAVITTPADGKEAVAQAVVVDAAGNQSDQGKDSALLDLTAPEFAPVVTIASDANNDGFINAKELGGGNNPIEVLITVRGQDVHAGDKLLVTVAGQAPVAVTLTDSMIQNGYALQVPNPGEGQTVKVSALIQDAAGNLSAPGSDSAVIDTQVDAGVLAFTDLFDSANPYIPGTANDGLTNDRNYGLAVSGAEAGSTISYQLNVNGSWVNTPVAQLNMLDGSYQYRAQVTDQAGNIGYTNQVAVTVDATAPAAPKDVVLMDASKVSGVAEAGSVVEVRENGVVVGWGMADAQGKFELNLSSAVSLSSKITATAIDVAGNVSSAAEAGRHYKVFTAASSWNDQHGPVDYGSYITTEGNDWIQIGNGAKNCWTWGTQGNIWNKAPWSGWAVIATGGGDDRIDTGVPGHQAWWGLAADQGGCGSMYAYTKVDMGTGNDTFNLKGSMVNDCIVDMGTGNDTFIMGGFMGTNTLVYMGEGDDYLSIGGSMLCGSTVFLGEGNDTMVLHGDMASSCSIVADAGDDMVTIKGFMGVNTLVDMGEGNDTVHLYGTMLAGAKIDMGAGDDTVYFYGRCIDGKIHGGEGNDTLVLDYSRDSSLVNNWAWKHVTNIATSDISGFETVQLKGMNALDVRYKDLLNDTTRDGALFIQGGSGSKVDLGATDWNSDTDKNLTDAGGGRWMQQGSATVDGITYDVYHHSYAGGSTQNDVYIQQGLMVI